MRSRGEDKDRYAELINGLKHEIKISKYYLDLAKEDFKEGGPYIPGAKKGSHDISDELLADLMVMDLDEAYEYYRNQSGHH